MTAVDLMKEVVAVLKAGKTDDAIAALEAHIAEKDAAQDAAIAANTAGVADVESAAQVLHDGIVPPPAA